MSLASKTVNNDIITIHIGGRIDANNAAAYGEEIFKKYTKDELIKDIICKCCILCI